VIDPIALLGRHRRRPYPFLLDRGETVDWSFAGSAPARQLLVDADGRTRLWSGRAWEQVDEDPLEAIETFVEASAAPLASSADVPAPLLDGVALPRTVGYFAYELGWHGDRPGAAAPVSPVPLAVLSTYDRFDAWHPSLAAPVALEFKVQSGGDPPPWPRVNGLAESPVIAEKDGLERYRRGFERIARAIRDGEIYQANLSRRITLPLTVDPADVYERMRRLQPVPEGAFLDLGGFQILSNSPERFLDIDGEAIGTHPIKGTRPRRADERADAQARRDLLADPKERAEHLMIVDLERNDLGRICRTGTVRVVHHAVLRSYPTVHHLVSEVRGELAPGHRLAAILRATFPGGSITGAPKLKAMEILAEVEGEPRGIYTGAIGCLNGSRSARLNIAIRTALVHGGSVDYRTGGGIVADSSLSAEFDETVTKARAFTEALVEVGSRPRMAV
jgi:para-aminobenzoate synthetase component 1